MAKIDSLIATLVQNNIPFASISPGKPVLLDYGGGQTKELSARVITAKQIQILLEEIASKDEWNTLFSVGHVEISYTSKVGKVKVMGLRKNDKLALYISSKKDAKATSDVHGDLSHEASVAVMDTITGSKNDIQEEGIRESSFAQSSQRPALAQIPDHAEASLGERRAEPFKAPGDQVPIDRFFRMMAERGCSDFHLTSGNPPLFRKDGDITNFGDETRLSPAQVERLLLPITPDSNYDEFILNRDTDFAYEIAGVGRFRCNLFMDRIGPGGVFRLIPSKILTSEQLNLSDKILDLCYLQKGLVVVTGPTGSGKSTTLAAMIDFINRKRNAHLITIEDPIEFVHPNKKCLVNQREIGVHTMSFKNALRAALREDPDIVLVGEMRDLETISIAIETAETGHLVFGTLHTNTAASTVDRIIDQFPPDRQAQVRTMLSESLRAVIAQTLCKKIGGGRIAALEILMIDHGMANLIRMGKTFQIPSMMSTKKGAGNIPLNDALNTLVQDGLVLPDEAISRAVDREGLRKIFDQMGTPYGSQT